MKSGSLKYSTMESYDLDEEDAKLQEAVPALVKKDHYKQQKAHTFYGMKG